MFFEAGAGLQWRDNRFPARLNKGQEELLLVLEIAVDRASGHSGACGDLRERSAVVAFFTDNCCRRRDEFLSGTGTLTTSGSIDHIRLHLLGYLFTNIH